MKAAIYARVSTADKQDFSRQINQLKDICKTHGYKPNQIDEYAESISGYKGKADRPRLQAILDKVEASPKYYSCIYVSEISRVGRNPTETRRIIDRLTDLGIPVYVQSLNQFTLEKGGKRNFIMSIILQVLMEYANLEAETTKERSKQGQRQSALNGKAQGSLHMPYGYFKDKDGMLKIESEEKKIIVEIFKTYATGKTGTKVISQILNERGVPTRTNKAYDGKTIEYQTVTKEASKIRWADATVYGIINNPIYKGQRKWKDEIIDAPQLRIVTDEVYDKCQEVRISKTHRNYLNKYSFLLKDMVVCGCCGRNFIGRYKPHKIVTRKNGDKKDVFENNYICSSRLVKNGGCKNTGVNLSLIESSILKALSDDAIVHMFLRDSNSVKAELEASIIKLLQSEKLETFALTNKNKEKERLLDIFLSEGIDKKTYKKRLPVIDKEIDLIAKRVDVIKKSLRTNKDALNELGGNRLTKKSFESFQNNRVQLQAYFKKLIKRVVVTALDTDNIFVTVHCYSAPEPDLRETWKHNGFRLLLDAGGLRKRLKEYRFKANFQQGQSYPYNDGKLIIKPEIIERQFLGLDWLYPEKILTVE